MNPPQAGIGSETVFTVAVPTEKSIPTIGLRLLIPKGVINVIPDVKAGWQIMTKRDANNTVTEIDWTGGVIPVGERDTFLFSAQVPAYSTILAWKAYQSYQDGSIVPWVDTPVSGKDDETYTPYAKTTVINDLQNTQTNTISAPIIFAITISSISLTISLVLLTRKTKVV